MIQYQWFKAIKITRLKNVRFECNKKNQTVHNNDNAIGNTAGNLINGGLFCEYNDKIYFANPDDYNKLYVMNSDCNKRAD